MNSLDTLLQSTAMRALGWTLVHFIWQGLLLFAVHEALQWFLRKRTAALRYATACVILFAMLLGVAFTLHLEMHRILVGAGNTRVQATLLESSTQSASRRTAREGATPPVVVSTLPDPHPSSGDAPAPNTPTARQHATPGVAARFAVLAQPLDVLQSRLPHQDLWLPWLVSLWFIGVFLLTTRLALGWQEALWLRTRAVRPVDADTVQRLRALVQRLRISRPVQVLESSLAEVPTVVGWLRPVVLLPAAVLTGMPATHLEALLAHELSHVKRHDYLVNLLQTLVETVLFYHPAVWWVSQRIRDERENCCDDVAVQVCGDAVLYARALTSMEEMRRGPLQPDLAMAADGGSLVQRVRRVVGRGGEPGAPGAGVVVAALLIGLSSLLAVAAARTAEVDSPAAGGAELAAPSDKASELLGGKIAGIHEAQPAPQLPRPVSVEPRPEPAVDQESGDPPASSTAAPGRPVFTLDEIVLLKKFDVEPDYYDAMTAIFGALDVEEIVALRNHEVDVEYVESMRAQFGPLDVEEVIALKTQDIDVDYAQEMSRAFRRDVNLEEIMQLRVQEVCRDDVESFREVDHHVEPREVAHLQAQGVDADDLEELQQLDLPGATTQELVRLAQSGYDANDLEELQDALGTFTLEEGVAMLHLGVDGDEVEQLQEMGLRDPSVDLLIHMYSRGLTADVIDTILDDEMDDVPVEMLVLFKELGLEDVFFPEFRRRNE